MTPEEFVGAIQEYYGKYDSEYKAGVVMAYAKKYSAGELEALHRVILLSFSDQYGKRPDVAAIERISKEHQEEIRSESGGVYVQNGEAYRGKDMIGHFDGGRFIPNLSPLQDSPLLVEYVNDHMKHGSSPEAYAEFLKRTDGNILEDNSEKDE